MNGGWRAWRKGTALHYRKNCLPLNVNRQAGEDGVCGGRIFVPVCPERRMLPESRECSGRKLVLAVRDEWAMMLGEWGKRGTKDFPGHGASVRMFFLCRKDRLKTQGFLLPVQQGGNAFFPVFRNSFQRGPGNQEGAFHAQLFSFFGARLKTSSAAGRNRYKNVRLPNCITTPFRRSGINAASSAL